MSNDVTPSFLEALKKVFQPEEENLEETVAPDKHKSGGTEMVSNNKGTKSAPKKDVDKFRKTLPEEEEELTEEQIEEQIIEVLEEELGPHIAYLLDEGFSEDEIEHIILEMLEEEEEEVVAEDEKTA